MALLSWLQSWFLVRLLSQQAPVEVWVADRGGELSASVSKAWLSEPTEGGGLRPARDRGGPSQDEYLAQLTKEEQQGSSASRDSTLGQRSVLFVSNNHDGLGVIVYTILHGMGLADKYNMDFGGMIKVRYMVHHVWLNPLVSELFGDQTVSDRTQFDTVLSAPADFRKQQPHERTVFGQLEAALAATPRPATVLIKHWNLPEMVGGALWGKYTDEIFSTDVRSRMRSLTLPAFQRRVDLSSSSKPLVALHVRRGDISKKGRRGTPDQWFFDIMAKVRALLPEGDVQIFSCTERRGTPMDPAEFDVFRSRGATVNLDKELLWDWAHFAAARVLVLSPSTYGLAPAVFNPNCVVWWPYLTSGFSWWIDGRYPNTTEFTDRLAACLSGRAMPPAQPPRRRLWQLWS